MKKLGFFSKKNAGVGLDLGSEWLKLVKIRPGKGDLVLESLARCPWQPGDLDNNSATAKKIAGLWSQLLLKEQVVASSMAGHAVIVKRVTFESDSLKTLPDTVHKDARQYIPFDINDVYLDFQVLGPGAKDNSYDVLLVASKKKVVQNLSEVIGQSGLSLSVIDVDSFAICNSFEHNYPELQEKPVYLLDIGGAQSVFCIYHKGQPVFLREVSFGGRVVTESLASILNLKRVEAERIKLGGKEDLDDKNAKAIADAVNKTFKNWCDELKRLIGFYQSSSSNVVPAESLYLSGGGALLGGLKDVFHRELNIDVQYHNPFRKIFVDRDLFQKEYLEEIGPQMVVPFGLALRAI
ncbi:MAG: type IV pilus assembly protein PilM [Desulfomicrobium sp.]|nr:type IV pilus assembly protein PilM [Pseudomonadota bacterium]MBV1710434.1 type IV pilus assembly protein PilM [Desulfomicrobium sp.]MBU4570055.1 type IV pilus assembly protein PilM [Pseudomonadota bacterium]MBU4593973.1 type IV pilus assembly protein PilM [Pseudomonadota bacterium]MBV1721106.1 type IV pilus assembly protein PilM [Desulfomicrobium sp.]